MSSVLVQAEFLLPGELAMLAAHGVAPSALREAARLARDWGTAPVDALLAARLASPETVYRALAAETGLAFLEPGFEVHPRTVFPQAVLSGVAPLPEHEGAPLRFVLAPTGEAFAVCLARGGGFGPALSIATPASLRDAVLAARGPTIARMAAEDLARRRPADSFFGGLTQGQALVTHAIAAAAGMVAVAFGGGTLATAAVLLGPAFLGHAAIKLAAACEPARLTLAPRLLRRRPDAALPVYTVLVALYRETAILPGLLEAMRTFDYPAAKLDLIILIEAGDDETADALRRLDPDGALQVVTVPAGVPQTKPRALNVGLMLARGRFLVVYDAEDVPDPGQLRDAVALFESTGPEVACLQARLVIDNTGDSWLTRLFTLEYGALFDVVNPALARFDLPMPIGGSSNHFRIDVLRGLGGWDPWNVTEDADLAVRLAIAGYRVADLPSVTREEAPSRLRPWLAQRARWMKGYVQVAITHSRAPLANLNRLGPARFMAACVLIFGTVLSAAAYPIFTLVFLAALWSGQILEPQGVADAVGTGMALSIGGAGLLAMLAPPLVAILRRRWWSLLPVVPLMPLYSVLVSVGAWRGIVELVLDPDRWNKTTHGLARTSASGRLPPRAADQAPGATM